MSAMTDRFQRYRWSTTRLAIDRMSVERLNDAYAGEREWTLKNRTEVTRIK